MKTPWGKRLRSPPLHRRRRRYCYCGVGRGLVPWRKGCACSRKKPVRFDSVRFRTFRKFIGWVRSGSDNSFCRFDAVRPVFFVRVVARSGSVRFRVRKHLSNCFLHFAACVLTLPLPLVYVSIHPIMTNTNTAPCGVVSCRVVSCRGGPWYGMMCRGLVSSHAVLCCAMPCRAVPRRALRCAASC